MNTINCVQFLIGVPAARPALPSQRINQPDSRQVGRGKGTGGCIPSAPGTPAAELDGI